MEKNWLVPLIVLLASSPLGAWASPELLLKCEGPTQEFHGVVYQRTSGWVKVNWDREEFSFDIVTEVVPPFSPSTSHFRSDPLSAAEITRQKGDSGTITVSMKSPSKNNDVIWEDRYELRISGLDHSAHLPPESSAEVSLARRYVRDAGERGPYPVSESNSVSLRCRKGGTSDGSSTDPREACACHWNPATGIYQQYCWINGPEGDVEFGHWTGKPCDSTER